VDKTCGLIPHPQSIQNKELKVLLFYSSAPFPGGKKGEMAPLYGGKGTYTTSLWMKLVNLEGIAFCSWSSSAHKETKSVSICPPHCRHTSAQKKSQVGNGTHIAANKQNAS